MNAKSARTEHQGALIRVRHDGYGYGCIHPWPELGDLGLEETLRRLACGKHTELSRCALQCAQVDAEARFGKRSLFDGLTVPMSHATLMMQPDDVARAVQAGFTTAKVKVGRDMPFEIQFIREQATRYPQLEWRLDFNGTQDLEAVEAFLRDLSEEARDKIDFVEDAYLLGTTPWVNALGPYGVPMAVDREVESACGGFGVAVIKPAINEVNPILEMATEEDKRVVFTSYMDHPLGQCYAAWRAAVAHEANPNLISTCGLITHGLFEPDDFTECLGKVEPTFNPPAGTGLGFDELLENLLWTPLN